MDSIIIIGAGGHAKAVIHTVERENKWHIAGLLDSNKQPGTLHYGYAVLGDESWLEKHDVKKGIIAIGDNAIRAKTAASIKASCPDFQFITSIDPAAIIARGAVIGNGSVLMAGTVIGCDVQAGQHTVCYPNCSIEHDSVIYDSVSFAPQAATGGNVSIGSCTAIGVGASIIHGISIGEHCVIGAGSAVVRSVPSLYVAAGTPARLIRTRQAGERYL